MPVSKIGRGVENRRSEAEADKTSVAESGGRKESRATERGRVVFESLAG